MDTKDPRLLVLPVTPEQADNGVSALAMEFSPLANPILKEALDELPQTKKDEIVVISEDVLASVATLAVWIRTFLINEISPEVVVSRGHGLTDPLEKALAEYASAIEETKGLTQAVLEVWDRDEHQHLWTELEDGRESLTRHLFRELREWADLCVWREQLAEPDADDKQDQK